MSIASSSSAVTYPCPLEVNASNFVPIKLARNNYSEWKQLMLDLIVRHRLVGFVDGTIKSPKNENEEEYLLWKTSDELVRRWIFETVIEEIQLQLVDLKTARDVWFALETFGISHYLPLHKAILNGNWKSVNDFLKRYPDGVRDAITMLTRETALMVAVRSPKRKDFANNLIEKMDQPADLARINVIGETALHVAMMSTNNNEVAKCMMEKDAVLPSIRSNDGTLAVHMAASRGNREMVVNLLKATEVNWEGELGVKLLNNLVYGGLLDIALSFLQKYPKLASMEPSPLTIMVHRSPFNRRPCSNFFLRLIYYCIPLKLEGNGNQLGGMDVEMNQLGGRDVENLEGDGNQLGGRDIEEGNVENQLGRRDVENSAEAVVYSSCYLSSITCVRKTKQIHYQALNFVKQYCKEVVNPDNTKAHEVFKAPLLEAASWGVCEIVEEILESFPDGIYFVNEKQQSIFHLAIENRQENVFNLIYQLEENKEEFMSMPDKSGNNALHTVANFASRQQLSLRESVAGAALQMQCELRWYKAVENLLPPQEKYARNKENKIPQDIFTETHKDLVKEGEKWMKGTASSCAIVAALIVTVVFTAAITVPGGTKDDTGIANFFKHSLFFQYGVSDAVALFCSTASLLIFLSMFTSRYGEQDFLYSLPTKLIIGLMALFVSIIAMMIAFAETLIMVFGHKKGQNAVPVAALSFLPIAVFALLQFSLLLNLFRSTCWPGMFRKRSNRIIF